MADYKAPLRDIRFSLMEVLDYADHCVTTPNCAEASPDIVDAILEESAKFCEQVLVPLNAVGDIEGCSLNNGEVSTPTGFKEAYQQYVKAGWPAMTHPEEIGGQGLPQSLGTILSEMAGSANWSWAMYPGLSHGAMNTINSHGSDQQKQLYLSKLIAGTWTGTMCLTEPQCGTDLSLLRTKAEPLDDGSYSISGNKIFISAGEHDMAENIVHIVLARLPSAPEGTKGISLFIVPKFTADAEGNLLQRNGVNCGALEHKMGIHGNATCALNFDDAKGYLIGEANSGLSCMFTFMNNARIGTALQGLAHTELGLQKSLDYSRDRLAMRALTGAKNPSAGADPIIVHPDVRRMLLTQKAFAEGNRMLLYFTSLQVDISEHSADQNIKLEAQELLALLTPIAKAFITETGYESANLALQCFGGHGYIREWGMEQNVRDARIATLYEGTTGIQALDLLGRKVLMTQGQTLKRFTKIIHKFCQAESDNTKLREFIKPLTQHYKEWGDMTTQLGFKAMRNRDEVGAAAVDYLMYSGYVALAYFWARAALIAQKAINNGAEDKAFYKAKIHTARFYFERILPRTRMHLAAIESGSDNLMALDEKDFIFI